VQPPKGWSMTQHPIELILLRQWAEHMAIPIWIMDASGDLAYYNEAAEGILGVRFDEAGVIQADRLAELFVTTALDGSPMASEDLPVVVALTKQVPDHRPVRIRAFDGSWRHIEVTAFPLEAQGGRFLGAVACFWESSAP
jgi:PAS domain-containing protein